MKETPTYAGLDAAKNRLDVVLRPSGEYPDGEEDYGPRGECLVRVARILLQRTAARTTKRGPLDLGLYGMARSVATSTPSGQPERLPALFNSRFIGGSMVSRDVGACARGF